MILQVFFLHLHEIIKWLGLRVLFGSKDKFSQFLPLHLVDLLREVHLSALGSIIVKNLRYEISSHINLAIWISIEAISLGSSSHKLRIWTLSTIHLLVLELLLGVVLLHHHLWVHILQQVVILIHIVCIDWLLIELLVLSSKALRIILLVLIYTHVLTSSSFASHGSLALNIGHLSVLYLLGLWPIFLV